MDLHCPIELSGFELTRDDRGNVRAYLDLFNLGDAPIERLDAVLTWVDGTGARLERPWSTQTAIGGRARVRLTALTDEMPDAAGVALLFTRVVFADDRPVFMHNPSHLVDVPELPLPDGRELNRLTALAGADAAMFPLVTRRLWICVCGRPNAYRRKACRRCRRMRDAVLTDFSMQAVMRAPAKRGKPVDVDLNLFAPPPEPQPEPDSKAGLRARFLRERALLIRRTVTFVVLAALIALIAWVASRPKPIVDSIPPVPIQTTAPRMG